MFSRSVKFVLYVHSYSSDEMLPDYDKRSEYNVIIFNQIANNEKDIELIRQTFEDLNCRIKLYNNLTRNDYEGAIQELCIVNFTIYEYIVVIVLDNNNRYSHELSTADNPPQHLRLNNDLLVRMQQNPTLRRLKQLFIIVTNQSESAEPPGESTTYTEHNTTNPIMLNMGPTIRLYATELNYQLENYWPAPNARISPFIGAFCKNFAKYAETKTIADIYMLMRRDLRNESFTPIIDESYDVKYGKAMSDRTKASFGLQ